MIAPRQFTEAEYVELNHLVSGGDIATSSKPELERFAVMLARPNAFTQFGAASFPQICETVRTLLIVRMSEEQNEQAKRESRLALIIACIALAMATIQVIVGLWPLVFSSPIQVEASKALPIFAPSPLPVVQAPQGSAAPPQKVPETATPKPSTHAPKQSELRPSVASSAVSK